MRVEQAIAIFSERFAICAEIITVSHGGTERSVPEATRLLVSAISEALDDYRLSAPVHANAAAESSAEAVDTPGAA